MASVLENMTRAINAFVSIKQAIKNKGVGVAENTPVEDYAGLIDSVEGGGGDTDAAYNEGYTQGTADENKRLLEARATGTEPSGDIVIDAETIVKGAFAYATKMNSATLPNATALSDNAFYTATLKSIAIPKVETIGGSVFYMCRNLSVLTLPASLKSIGTTAFGYTTLKTVTFEGTPESIATNAFTGSSRITDIFVPWSEGEVANAPWGATNANLTIHYNSEVAT